MNIIEGPYYRDILAQPRAFADTVAGLSAQPLPEWLPVQVRAPGTRLVLTGMGASLHALHPLAARLVAAGLFPVTIETSELIHHARGLLSSAAVVVAVSQSGASAETVRLLTDPGGATVVGVTNNAASPLYSGARFALATRAGAEATVSCKTYVATLAALDWLGAGLCGHDLAAELTRLATVPDALTSLLRPLAAAVAAQAERLSGARQIYFVGRGASLAATYTAALITKEAVHFPAEGMSSAAFRHGPLEMAGPENFVLIYEGGGASAGLNRKLCDDIRAAGGRAELCGPGAPDGPFRLASGIPEASWPVLEIVPAQIMTLALSALLGREAGRFSHATKITATE